MASEAPSWADQWGAGGFGSMEEDNYATKQDTSNEKKSDAKGGLNKAKTAAMSGAQKLKSGASSSFKWVKSTLSGYFSLMREASACLLSEERSNFR
uniref:Uncharacterized protein n=1 Tax=Salix viminalis TaxID=40686 RepID=A0A6N2KYU5_SALVM